MDIKDNGNLIILIILNNYSIKKKIKIIQKKQIIIKKKNIINFKDNVF